MVRDEEDGIGGRRSGVLIKVLMVPGVALLVLAASVRWPGMVSVLGFVTWSPVHLTIGISTTVTLSIFKCQMTSLC